MSDTTTQTDRPAPLPAETSRARQAPKSTKSLPVDAPVVVETPAPAPVAKKETADSSAKPSAPDKTPARTNSEQPARPGDTTGGSAKSGPRILAFMNQKGGVGKTTTAVNIGAALAEAGHRVLLIDLDPQAHMTLHVGVDPSALDHTIYDLMTDDDVAAADIAQQVGERLAVLPAEVNLAGAETELAPRMATGLAQRILKHKCEALLDPAADLFDYALIDCPPSLGLLTINALTLAGEVVVPMQAHFLALQGLSKLLETILLIRQSFNPALIVAGVTLCMHEKQTLLAQEVMGDLTSFLEESAGRNLPWSGATLFHPPVRRNIKLAECPSFGKTIFDYAPESHGAADYRALAGAIHAAHVKK